MWSWQLSCFSESCRCPFNAEQLCCLLRFRGCRPHRWWEKKFAPLWIDHTDSCEGAITFELFSLTIDLLAVYISILTAIAGSIHFTALLHHSNTIVLGATDRNFAAYKITLSWCFQLKVILSNTEICLTTAYSLLLYGFYISNPRY